MSNQPIDHSVLRVLRTKAEAKAFYNKIASVYDLLSENSEEPLRKFGIDKLAVQNGERILEIGFGTGTSLIELATLVGPEGKVFSVDLADEMLKVASQKLRNAGLENRVELTCGDAMSLPYPAESMDAIFTSFTLELFDTPEIPMVLEECKRVLRPGGRLVVVSMSKEGENGALVHIFEWTHQHFPNFLDCRPIFVRDVVETVGFQIESDERKTMWVPVEIVLGRKLTP